jgi:hypothetical protein
MCNADIVTEQHVWGNSGPGRAIAQLRADLTAANEKLARISAIDHRYGESRLFAADAMREIGSILNEVVP